MDGSKRKLGEQMDSLDVSDRHYNRKYQDMQDRLDVLYDKIDELRDLLEEVNSKINDAQSSQISNEYLLTLLQNFGILYSQMSDFEKKEFYDTIIKKIELYPDYTEEGRILKHIDFKFPVSYDSEDEAIRLINENDVETVCLLSRKDK